MPTTRPHLGTINNVQALQLGLHPLNNPPSSASNAGVLYNRQRIDRGGLIEMWRATEIEAVFDGLGETEEHDVVFASSSLNPASDDPVAETTPDTWRMTGAQHITQEANTIRFTAAAADLFTVRLLNPINSGAGLRVKFYITKYGRSDA